jgi:hypothetical protein
MVMIDVEVEVEDTEDIYEAAGDYASDAIAAILKDAGVDFDFCDDFQVYDEEGNEVEAL